MTGPRIAADVGGTFTDVVLTDGAERVVALKVPSTPAAFEQGVLAGLAAMLDRGGLSGSHLQVVLHATTAGTNAVLERSGPATALIATRGFRDVLEIGRLRRPTLYDLRWRKPPPLVPRHLRLEVSERIATDGAVLTPVEFAGLGPEIDAAVNAGVESLAVSLINAHANPVHEHAVASFVRERHPNLLVTVGTAVVREIGEFERTSTAVLNAYLRPVISAYLDRLADGLLEIGAKAPVLVMQSSGGMMPVSVAARLPVHLCESGPAAGVLAAAHIAEVTGDRNVISFDMGGTTAKASLIEDFTPLYASEFSVGSELSATSRLLRGGGYAIRLPVIDLAEVGAGGGSIARVDSGGALVVGPASVGANPGPACYGKGGTAATVTDANLLLGYVSVRNLAVSGVGVDVGLAASAIRRQVGEPLGLTVTEAALAVHRVANQQMARVLRAVSTERGRTVSDYTLVAFGGCGGLHAASLATAVGMRRVVVPPLAGVLSCVGLLWAPVEMSVTETVALPLSDSTVPTIYAIVNRLAVEQQELLDATLEGADSPSPSAATRGGSTTKTDVIVNADLRYPGEGSELTLPLTATGFDLAAAADLARTFQRRHVEIFGHGDAGPIEVVRIRATARRSAAPIDPISAGIEVCHEDVRRTARFNDGIHEVPVVSRSALHDMADGPLLIDEADTTTVVPPGWRAHCDDTGNLILVAS